MIVVVPARGGSKGLPRKNIMAIAGQPLIAHTLECALQATRVERVVVSTDDEEIAAFALTIPGVEVPFLRPAHLAADTASAIDVYLHAGEWLATREICALLPTAPLRTSADVDAAINMFEVNNADVVLSVMSAKPASWQQNLATDGRLEPVKGISASVENRQAFGATVIPNGAIYVLNLKALASSRTYFGPRTWGYLMPADRSVDIDGPDDFFVAEAVLEKRKRSP